HGGTVQGALSYRPELGVQLLVLAKESGEPLLRLPVASACCLHLINAFEEGARLTVDLLELTEPVYPEYRALPNLFQTVTPARPVRLVVDLERRTVSRREAALPVPLAADFPSYDRRRTGLSYRDFWMLAISATGKQGRKFFDRLMRVDWQDGGQVDFYQAP